MQHIPSFLDPAAQHLRLDAGTWPISNRFLAHPHEPQEHHAFVLAQCQRSGLLYLSTPFPATSLVPRFDWMTYNEPEAHLDELVEQLHQRRGAAPGTVAGLSNKDDSTLERLERLGWTTWRPHPQAELGLPPHAGAESLQTFHPTMAEALLSQHPRVDMLVVRHVFEHVYDIPSFLEACRCLLAPGGQLVLEVPDCSRALSIRDYTTLWEEHTFYFTPETLEALLVHQGWRVDFSQGYPYPFEDSRVLLLTPVSSPSREPLTLAEPLRTPLLEQGVSFGAALEPLRLHVRKVLESLAKGKAVAVMGAGHLTLTFLELFQLSDLVTCVLDDNPHKQGLYLPGAGLPILPSSRLLSHHDQPELGLCLLGLNPMNEEKVVARQAAFVQRGGCFRSIFPISSRALYGRAT
ncbi:MAG: methyltransferase domain-containing protein [Myxococcota bacterium]